MRDEAVCRRDELSYFFLVEDGGLEPGEWDGMANLRKGDKFGLGPPFETTLFPSFLFLSLVC